MGKFSFCCGSTCLYSCAALLALLVGWVGYLQMHLPELKVHYTSDGEEDHVDAYILQVRGEDYYTDEPLVVDVDFIKPLLRYPMLLDLFVGVMKFSEPFLRDPLTIHNARLFERSEGLTKAQFFEKHGFVLLKAPTAMTEHDWLNSTALLTEDGYGGDGGRDGMALDEQSLIGRKYGPEVKAMIYGQLYEPGTVKKVLLPNMCLRRGVGAPNGVYGYGAHLDAENTYENFIKATNFTFADEKDLQPYIEADHFETINFWRPVAPMKGPIRRAPLAVLDSQTVKKEDTFPQVIKGGFIQGGVELRQTYMRRAPGQKWYYYPEMTTDEVLVMKQGVYKGLEEDGNLEPVFHTAFDHPATPADAEHRQSSEYRVGVIF